MINSASPCYRQARGFTVHAKFRAPAELPLDLIFRQGLPLSAARLPGRGRELEGISDFQV